MAIAYLGLDVSYPQISPSHWKNIIYADIISSFIMSKTTSGPSGSVVGAIIAGILVFVALCVFCIWRVKREKTIKAKKSI